MFPVFGIRFRHHFRVFYRNTRHDYRRRSKSHSHSVVVECFDCRRFITGTAYGVALEGGIFGFADGVAEFCQLRDESRDAVGFFDS